MKAVKAAIGGGNQELTEETEFWYRLYTGLPSSPRARSRRNDGPLSRSEKHLLLLGGKDGDQPPLPDGRFLNKEALSYIRKEVIKRHLRERESSFASYSPVTVVCASFNVNGKKETEPDLSSWLGWREDADLYAIGFQELVDLNAVNVAVSDSKSQQRVQLWRDTIEQYLRTCSCKYLFVRHRVLVGVALFIFIKSDHRGALGAVQDADARTGFGGVLGNKGGVSIRLSLYDTTFCFVCSHLAAHRGNVNGRNADYWSIVDKTDFVGEEETACSWEIRGLDGWMSQSFTASSENWGAGGGIGILDHDVVFWIGDLNYRIDERVPMNEIFGRLQTRSVEDMNYLRAMDQLNISRGEKAAFCGFQEGQLEFLPTYKYQAGTHSYDQRPDKKVRAPAWCDRVLWRATTPSHAVLAHYGRAELLLSDHKPISAVIKVQIRRINHERHYQLYREIADDIGKTDADHLSTSTAARQQQSEPPDVKLASHVIDFGNLGYMQPAMATLKVANVGSTNAYLRFTTKSQEIQIQTAWLRIEPTVCLVKPGFTHEFRLVAKVDSSDVFRELASGDLGLNSLLILRVEGGKEHYVQVKATFANSFLGLSLDNLVARERGGGILGIPKLIWSLIQGVASSGALENPSLAATLFTSSGEEKEVAALLSFLGDCGEGATPDAAMLPRVGPHAYAQVFLLLLRSLPEALVSSEALKKMEVPPSQSSGVAQGPRFGEHQIQLLLGSLSPKQHNVFLYFMSFLRTVVTCSASEKLGFRARQLAGAVVPSLCFESSAKKKCFEVVCWFIDG